MSAVSRPHTPDELPPGPHPTPQPQPQPAPGPTPDPRPQPTPEPAPDPRPEPTPEPEPTPGPASEPTPVRAALLQAGALVGAHLSLIAALLFYFGWIRSKAQAEYLGFAEAHLDASLTWYVLVSVPALFEPLLYATAVALLWRIGDPRLVPALRARPRVRVRVCLALAASPVLVPVIAWGLVLLTSRGWWELMQPLSLTAGVLLGCYGGSLWSRTGADDSGGEQPGRRLWTGSASLYAGAVVVVLVFWTVGRFATVEGRGAAEQFVATMDDQPDVVVYSAKDLRINAPGVRTTVYRSPGEYRYRYQGLKLYAYSGGKLFLLPAGWTYERSRVLVLAEKDGIRIEYAAP